MEHILSQLIKNSCWESSFKHSPPWLPLYQHLVLPWDLPQPATQPSNSKGSLIRLPCSLCVGAGGALINPHTKAVVKSFGFQLCPRRSWFCMHDLCRTGGNPWLHGTLLVGPESFDGLGMNLGYIPGIWAFRYNSLSGILIWVPQRGWGAVIVTLVAD